MVYILLTENSGLRKKVLIGPRKLSFFLSVKLLAI
jgi:hypothetical protein